MANDAPTTENIAGSLAVVERLTAVLPALTTNARGGGKLARLTRRIIDQHLRVLLLDARLARWRKVAASNVG